MQTLIVILIVAIAAAFLVRNFLKKFKQEDQCGCGCASCPTDPTSCEENQENSISALKNSSLSSKTEKKSSEDALKLEVPKMTKMS
jgi:hypothetical protein